MTAIQLGVSNYARTAQSPVLLGNMYVENDPTNVIDGKVRFQRPGLNVLLTLPTSPVRGMAQQDGVFNGDMIVVAGAAFYRVSPFGAVIDTESFPNGDLVNTALGPGRSISVNAYNGTVWSYDGTTLTAVVMPSGVLGAWVTFISGYFLIGQQYSQRIYWLAPGDVNPDALNFFSAESQPDNTVGAETLADDVWIFGTSSTEVWSPSGDLNLPFTRSQGRLYDKGCVSRDTIVRLDNTLFWVGSDYIVYRADSVPIRVSDNSLEADLRNANSAGMRAWGFVQNGHAFYVLTFTPESLTPSSGTAVFDVSQGDWPAWTSYGYDYWRAHLGVQLDPKYNGKTVYAGDAVSGAIWTVDPDVVTDAGQPIVRELTGFVGIITEYARCNSLEMSAGRGRGASPSAPVILQVRWSDDEGATWTGWRDMSLGRQGDYRVKLQLQALGRMSMPGRTFHFRSSDASQLRISYARINEGAGSGS